MQSGPDLVEGRVMRRRVAHQDQRLQPRELREFGFDLLLRILARGIEWRDGRVSKSGDLPSPDFEAALVKIIQTELFAHRGNLRRLFVISRQYPNLVAARLQDLPAL